jgi:hypothetical protein
MLAFRRTAHACRREHLMVEELSEGGALTRSVVAISGDGSVSSAVFIVEDRWFSGRLPDLGTIVLPFWPRWTRIRAHAH